MSHWAHFTVHRFICIYLCVFCVFLFYTAYVLYYQFLQFSGLGFVTLGPLYYA